MGDIFKPYMTMSPEIEYFDTPVSDFSLESLRAFMDEDGAITKSFDAVVKIGRASCRERVSPRV